VDTQLEDKAIPTTGSTSGIGREVPILAAAADCRPDIHQIVIDGVVQRYHVAGTGPVCLAHPGGPGAPYEYLRMPRLEESLTMVYVEPIGTGESGRLAEMTGYTVEAYARFLHGIIEHLAEPRVYLMGHSHGGFVAQAYALQHPERLAGLILYSTAATTVTEFWAEARRNADAFVERHRGGERATEAVEAAAAFHAIVASRRPAAVPGSQRRSPAVRRPVVAGGDRHQNAGGRRAVRLHARHAVGRGTGCGHSRCRIDRSRTKRPLRAPGGA
jgi:pimeloyl-ACP methyl ester carboxylesterase